MYTDADMDDEGGRGEYSGFQVTGMIEEYFGFQIFDSRIFLVTQILVACFEQGFFGGIKKNRQCPSSVALRITYKQTCFAVV